ncbi:MAG: hypothetical protein LBJ10_09625, partial [Clostridiales bacterium]|nr:hypothetical protein [Clostridiales bacterium]
MNRLKLLKFGVALKITKTTRLPTFIGNTIRGAFGKALPEHGEARGRVFKTSPTESVPNPFVISAPYPGRSTYSAGDILGFSLTLIGAARDYESEVRAALGGMCNGRLESAEVAAVSTIYDREWSDGGAETIPRCGKLSVNFITPTE